ncbi:MAG: globin family protein [Kiloniellales bacterium]|nr:globin family protein [Kiloniellales bacterium]
MSPDQKALVQETWRHVEPIADTAASLFYGRLFAIDPSTRPLFAGVDLEKQRKKLLQALTLVVASLERIEELVPAIQDLGRRHVAYGVTDAHYDSVGDALMWTLEQGLGNAWTAEAEAAWAAAYGLLSGVMREAAGAANDTAAEARREVA